ncbi:MAG TPA: hypothetical protein VGU66_19020 [Candidatus Elarobacter sp.]|nr:hypothetical protein [Candidatus Elarobacter sp.]
MTRTATVLLDVFSGRENTRWVLDAQQTRELERRLAHLQRATSADVADTGRLGYRGLRVTIHDDAGDASFVVADGIVRLASERRFDPGSQFELWLLGTGAKHVEPALLQRIAASVRERR